MDWKRLEVRQVGSVVCALLMGSVAWGAGAQQLTLQRGAATVVVEAYAPNIVRVTMSLDKARALAAAGYGIVARPQSEGWTAESGASGDVLKSSRMVVSVAPQPKPYTSKLPDTAKFFNGYTPWVGLSVKTPDGVTLLDMRGWEMSVPNYKDGNHNILNERRPGDDPYFQVGATFAAPKDEHYYGLGQNQEGYFDRRGRVVRCAHDYNAPGGQSVCVPFVVTNKGYGILWDNPARTTVAFAIGECDEMDERCGTARVVLCDRG